MKRHMGIDLLRIVSMYMVVILHILGIGGILDNAEYESLNYFVFWSIETICFVGVNCFALITGYFMIKGKWRLEKFIYLWFEVFFYSVVLSIMTQYILGTAISVPIHSLFPLLTKSYWFFSAYAGLFLLIPLLNKGIILLSKKEMKYSVGVIALLGTASVVSQADPFNLYKGYSMIWLAFMYIIGAYLKLHVDVEKIATKKLWLVYLGINGVALTLMIISSFNPFWEETMGRNWFIDYVSPLILSSSIVLFILFLKTRIKNQVSSKIITAVAPFSFGVYLIHTHPMVFYFILKNQFVDLANEHLLIAVVMIFLYGSLIYIGSSLLDYGRSILFQFLKINNLSVSLSEKVQDFIK